VHLVCHLHQALTRVPIWPTLPTPLRAGGLGGCVWPARRGASWRRLGLFKVLILCSQGSERQHGLRNHRPVRIGNRPIVQLTQARDGAVPHTANPMPDHPPVHAGCIIRDITHPPDPLSWAFMGRFFILPLPDAVAARMEAP